MYFWEKMLQVLLLVLAVLVLEKMIIYSGVLPCSFEVFVFTVKLFSTTSLVRFCDSRVCADFGLSTIVYRFDSNINRYGYLFGLFSL